MSRFALAATLAAASLLAPLAAEAQKVESLSYRCVGKDRKTYYGQTPPSQCAGLPVELLNAQGLVVQRIDPQADAEKKALKEAEEAKKRQDEAAVKERLRRDKALLASYTGEADIEGSRKRALAENDKAIAQYEGSAKAARKAHEGYTKELEFYQGKNKPPADLLEKLKSNEALIRELEDKRELRKKEVAAINAKFDEDKRRYIELTRGTPAPAAPTKPTVPAKK